MEGGWRSGRERKACTYPEVEDRELCEGVVFAARLDGSQPGRVLVRAIHATLALTALRTFRRESFMLKSSFLPVATSSDRLVEGAGCPLAGEHKQQDDA